MMLSSKNLVLLILALSICNTASADVVDSFNADKNPGDDHWGVAEVGWIYTPDFNYNLTGVRTKFGSGGSDYSRTVTVEVYDELPSQGGTLLRSAFFTPSANAFAGGSFQPLTVSAGEDYFIGFRNVRLLGDNFTTDPGAEPVSNLHFSVENTGAYAIENFVPNFMQVILQFEDDQSEPNLPDPCDLDPNISYRGIAFLSSNINNGISLDEIRNFVSDCNIDFVVIDFAWITYHWSQTDLAAVEQLASELVSQGIAVAAMYRPRALSPSDANIHYAENCDGTTDPDHNHLCFAYEDSVAWGAHWGTEILNALPSVNKVIIYNLLAPCCCELCQADEGAQGVIYAEQFMERCRSEWNAVRPGVQIGHVGMGTEYAEQVDFFCPFLSINRENPFRNVDVRFLLNQIFEEKLHKGILFKVVESSTGNNDPTSYVAFASKESSESQIPVLELTFSSEIQDAPITGDTTLISYLPNTDRSEFNDLCINMNDENRILFNFDLRAVPIDAVLERAELVLDMSQTQIPTVEPFDLGVHGLIGCWYEHQPIRWSNQPAFQSEPSATATIDPNPGIKRIDITDIVRDIVLLELYKKPVIPLAKICWETATDNTTEDIIDTIHICDNEQTGFILWYYDWIFHNETGRYDSQAITEALCSQWDPTNPPNSWVYFESKESTEGQAPVLALTFNDGNQDIVVSEDTVLISYIPDTPFGGHARLSINMNDTNRDLLAFSLSNISQGATLERAELVLDMKQSGIPTIAPFDLGVHVVTELWSEQTTTWNNQPAYEMNPSAIVSIDPNPGLKVIDITGIVSNWLGETVPNFGLLLKVAEEIPDIPNITFPYEEQILEPLPWPHQAPNLDIRQINLLVHQLWVINDYPLYQSGEEGLWRYYHGGLDIVLDNDTAIYAMKDGWVKSINSSTITIADNAGSEPCYGWEYTHLSNFQVQVGDFVTSGTFIGEVDFDGLSHIHLTKVFSEGDYWGQWRYMCMPNGHFSYIDEEPPVINTPFYFFENNSDTEIEPDAAGSVVLSGQVDIVVPMREQGLYSRSNDSGYGDRLAVTKIEYEIRPAGCAPESGYVFQSFDFNDIKIKSGVLTEYGTELTKVVYKHWTLFEAERPSGDKTVCYYIITNCSGEQSPQELYISDKNYCWDTNELDHNGQPVFPNGSYDIIVTAYDFSGHSSTQTMTVEVDNPYPELLVPEEFPTIQEAIFAAVNGDIISVTPGIYEEEIDFLGKAITVQGAPAAAIIDGAGGFAVSFFSDEGSNSVLRNFVIRNSYMAIFLADSSPTIRNVTVCDNEYGVAAFIGAQPDISNSIFWNNTVDDLLFCQASYSCIEDADNGLGNISEEPLFVAPDSGDFHLQSQGWRWDSQREAWTWDYVTSRCIDAGNPGVPLDKELLTVPVDPGNVWGENLRINMGAYGGTSEASMPPYNWSLLSDINNDGTVNLTDFAIQSQDYCSSNPEQPGDLNRNGAADIADLPLVAEEWLEQTNWP